MALMAMEIEEHGKKGIGICRGICNVEAFYRATIHFGICGIIGDDDKRLVRQKWNWREWFQKKHVVHA